MEIMDIRAVVMVRGAYSGDPHPAAFSIRDSRMELRGSADRLIGEITSSTEGRRPSPSLTLELPPSEVKIEFQPSTRAIQRQVRNRLCNRSWNKKPSRYFTVQHLKYKQLKVCPAV